MGLTIIETGAYLELRQQLSTLSVQVEDLTRKVAPLVPDKWMDAQEVCLVLGISKRSLQACHDRELVPCSHISGKYFYRGTDIQ